jgi:hypothetical protein
VDAKGDTHDHVLGSLDDFLIARQQIGALQRFEAEVVIVVVAVINNG